MKFYEDNGNAMISWLYDFYLNNSDYLPPEYRYNTIVEQFYKNKDNIPNAVNQERLIVDYLAGMMDEYVKTTYNHLKSLEESKK